MSYSECYPDKAPKVDRLMNALSSPHRRELIQYFESTSQRDTESLDTLISHLDERMPATSPTELEIEFHHNHLPKLEQGGWIDYDPREQRIHYHGKDIAEPLLTELVSVFSE